MHKAIYLLAAGNFAIGTSVLLVNGLLDHIARDLRVSVVTAGQLTTIFATTVAIAGPVLATATARVERRNLLIAALITNACGNLLAATSSDFIVLAAARIVSAFGAAVFVPQAAATAALLVPPNLRGRGVTLVFSGFVIATVVGVPIGNTIGANFGWRSAFIFASVVPLIAAAFLFVSLPTRVHSPSANASVWAQLLRSPALMCMIATTAVQMTGQLTLLVYLAPWLKDNLQIDSVGVGWMFMAYGIANGVGMIVAASFIDRIGAGKLATGALGIVFFAMAIFPLVQRSLLPSLGALACWGVGSLAINAAMQTRLITSAPWLSTASVPLNSSAISVGQAMGAVVGGWAIAHDGYSRLAWFGAAIIFAAAILSVTAERQPKPQPA